MINSVIYDDENYTAVAKWCNANNACIEEIEHDEYGRRRFRVIEIPKLTTEELAELDHLQAEAEAEAQRIPDLEDATVELADYVVSLEERIAELEAKLNG